MTAEQGRTRWRLVLSALVCALVLGAIGFASYDRLFSRSAATEDVSPIARLVEQTPRLHCDDVEVVDTLADLSEEPPTWQTAGDAARSLAQTRGETAQWFYTEPGLAVASVTDAEGRVVRTASLLRMLPLEGWTLKNVMQCAPPAPRT